MEIITEQQYNEFSNINKNNIKKFSLEDKIFIGKVVEVYDGDTCKIAIYFKNEFMKFTMRMLGYDTPELRTKNEIEKKFGYISKEMLERLILNKIVKVFCHKFDKYGRILCSIIVINMDNKEEINVNDYSFMIDIRKSKKIDGTLNIFVYDKICGSIKNNILKTTAIEIYDDPAIVGAIFLAYLLYRSVEDFETKDYDKGFSSKPISPPIALSSQ